MDVSTLDRISRQVDTALWEAERKLTSCRASLLYGDQQFWGTLGLKLTPVQSQAYTSMATDGVSLFYNPEWIKTVTDSIVKGVLFHDYSHVALRHHERVGNKDLALANIAADHVVNLLARACNYDLPSGAYCDPRFEGFSFEQVYEVLDRERRGPEPDGEEGEGKPREGPQDAPGAPTGSDLDPSGQGAILPAPDPVEGEPESDPIDVIDIAQAYEQAQAMGWEPGGAGRIIERVLSPRINWPGVLADFVDSTSDTDWTWINPDRHYIQMGLYMPSLEEPEVKDIVVAVDTSGSVNDKLLAQFAAEIESIRDTKQCVVRVVYADSVFQGAQEFGPGEEIVLDPKGGGGTNFAPPFKWVEDEGLDPSCLIYFTDLCGSFPDTIPDYPVLWACYRYHYKPNIPFGRYLSMVD